jgi:hypothetical protein
MTELFLVSRIIGWNHNSEKDLCEVAIYLRIDNSYELNEEKILKINTREGLDE